MRHDLMLIFATVLVCLWALWALEQSVPWLRHWWYDYASYCQVSGASRFCGVNMIADCNQYHRWGECRPAHWAP